MKGYRNRSLAILLSHFIAAMLLAQSPVAALPMHALAPGHRTESLVPLYLFGSVLLKAFQQPRVSGAALLRTIRKSLKSRQRIPNELSDIPRDWIFLRRKNRRWEIFARVKLNDHFQLIRFTVRKGVRRPKELPADTVCVAEKISRKAKQNLFVMAQIVTGKPQEEAYIADERFKSLLEKMMAERKPFRQRKAARELRLMNDPRAAQPFLTALRSLDVGVREEALRAVGDFVASGHLQYRDASDVLCDMAVSEVSPKLRRLALALIADMDDPGPVQRLIGLVEDGTRVERSRRDRNTGIKITLGAYAGKALETILLGERWQPGHRSMDADSLAYLGTCEALDSWQHGAQARMKAVRGLITLIGRQPALAALKAKIPFFKPWVFPRAARMRVLLIHLGDTEALREATGNPRTDRTTVEAVQAYCKKYGSNAWVIDWLRRVERYAKGTLNFRSRMRAWFLGPDIRTAKAANRARRILFALQPEKSRIGLLDKDAAAESRIIASL